MSSSADNLCEVIRRRDSFIVLEKQVAWKTVKRHQSTHLEYLLDSPAKSCTFLEGILKASPVELLYAVALNSRNCFVGCTKLAAGTVDRATVYPRLLVSFLLSVNASAVILAHNHPGGKAIYSSEDIHMTKQLVALLHSMDIRLLDHLLYIPAHGHHASNWVSMQMEGLLS